MTIPQNPRDDRDERREYQYIEYESTNDTVAVIQDRENERAWIQSTLSRPVEP